MVETSWTCLPEKLGIPALQRRELIFRMQQGLADNGHSVSISQLCRWFDVPRRTVYYRPRRSPPSVDPALALPIKALIEK
jgi:putative transposase